MINIVVYQFLFLFTFALPLLTLVSHDIDSVYAGAWDELGGSATSGGVSNNAYDSWGPSLSLDSSGNPHIAWRDNSGGNPEIYYAYWDGTNWVTHGGANTGGGVSNNTGISGRPSLVLDSFGYPHIAWEDYTGGDVEIYYAYWDGANWATHGGANTGGGVSNNAGGSWWPSLALDSSGNPHIAWGDNSGGDFEIHYRYWNPAGVTTTTTTTMSSTTTTTFPSLLPKICRTCPPKFDIKQGKTACKKLKIWNCLKGTLNWSVSEDCDWMTLEPSSGTSTRKKSKVTVCVDTTGLEKGDYECTVTITDERATNSPQTCVIKLKVK